MKTLLHKKEQILSKNKNLWRAKDMFRINIKKLMMIAALMFVGTSLLCATNSYALFEDLAQHGGKIFTGMREIIYAVSGFGITAVVIGAIFGNINYKWLAAILIGLFVIAGAAGLINFMVGDTLITQDTITDTIITGDSGESDGGSGTGE